MLWNPPTPVAFPPFFPPLWPISESCSRERFAKFPGFGWCGRSGGGTVATLQRCHNPTFTDRADGSSLRNGRDEIRVLVKAIMLLNVGVGARSICCSVRRCCFATGCALMGRARNLCSLQKRLSCLNQLIGGEGGLSL